MRTDHHPTTFGLGVVERGIVRLRAKEACRLSLSVPTLDGGAATTALMLPHGLVVDVLAAAFGGSALALAGDLLLAPRCGDASQGDAEPTNG